MNSLSITQLARFAGVMPHTIRMWEQRYQALSPARTEGNTRYYDSGDLKRLLNIVSLTDEYKVSELCRMTNIELNTLVEKTFLSTDQNDFGIFISQLLAAGMEFNEASF
ncbi:MAG: MerR family transcriptional regulator, partial [Ginsengibacter sp.]